MKECVNVEDLIYSESGGLIDWVNNYGNVVYFFGQILFWLGLLIFLGYAVFQYKRWVNYQLGTGKSGELRKAQKDEVSVDQFVD